jgi:hypothetical protein
MADQMPEGTKRGVATGTDVTARMLDRLNTVLDVHGAAPQKWPDQERAWLQALVDQIPEARRLVAEAKALDQLLGMAPAAGASPSLELSARIVAAAGRQGQPPHGRQAVPRAGAPASRRWANLVPGPAVLAAALALGLWLGTDSVLSPTLDMLLGDSGFITAGNDGADVIDGDPAEAGELL